MPTNPTQDATHAGVGLLRARDQTGLTIIEVLIALVVVAIVTTGAVSAMSGAGHVNSGNDVRSQEVQIAQRMIDDLNADANTHGSCAKMWNNVHESGTTWKPCGPKTETRTGAQGRKYTVTWTVTPIDDPNDGQGGPTAAHPDADGRTQDYYNVAVNVVLNADSLANLGPNAAAKPPMYALQSRLNWTDVEMGHVAVASCAHYRPDRSLDQGGCASGSSKPVGGIAVKLTPAPGVPGNTARATSLSTAGNGTRTGYIVPGDYKVKLATPSSYASYRANPSLVHVDPGGSQQVAVSVVPKPAKVQVCAQLDNSSVNADGFDDGYTVNQIAVEIAEPNSPVYRGVKIDQLGTSGYRCQMLPDPLGYNTHNEIYHATYGIAVAQQSAVLDPSLGKQQLSKVDGITSDCGLSNPSSAKPTVFDNAQNWPDTFRKLINLATGPCANGAGEHHIYLKVHSAAVPDVDCTASDVASGACTHDVTRCVQYCPNGVTKCVANCTGGPTGPPPGTPGSSGTITATSYGGPNDGDIGGKCLWNSTGSGWQYGTASAARLNIAGIHSKYVGGHAGSTGHFADGTAYDCHHSYVIATYNFPIGTCLQLEYKGNTIRALVKDHGAVGHIDLTVGMATALNPQMNYDAYYWHDGAGSGPVQYTVIHGDPVCDSDNAPQSQYFPPVIKKIKVKPVEPPGGSNPSFTSKLAGNQGNGTRAL